jgi:hypothetical protein
VLVHRSKQEGRGRHLVDRPGNRQERESERDRCSHGCCLAREKTWRMEQGFIDRRFSGL